jgi:hypothetical protein
MRLHTEVAVVIVDTKVYCDLSHCNRRPTLTALSPGVRWDEGQMSWSASVGSGEDSHLGFFRSEKQAARAYRKAIAELGKQSASLSPPPVIDLGELLMLFPTPIGRLGSHRSHSRSEIRMQGDRRAGKTVRIALPTTGHRPR